MPTQSKPPISDPLSPLDGRYARETAPLREYWTEFAFFRQRVRVELDYVRALAHNTSLTRPLTPAEEELLAGLTENFDSGAADEIRIIEQKTRHDVKAIEYYLRERLQATPLGDMIEWLHFGLTSEDVNLMAQALALRDSRDAVILPALDAVIASIAGIVRRHRGTVMLARTHGQPAVPSTLGKEFAVFLVRLKQQRAIIRNHRFQAKLTGAVGNLNALVAAAPQVDWLAFGDSLIRSYGLEPNPVTTQLLPYDNWIRYFDALRLTNSILIDLAQDAWRYISDDYLRLRVVAGEVGSSTMPQKVNPIDLENAEGNLGVANALLSHYAQKLAVSRLQRDLSDSTVRRTFGVALGHSLVGYVNMRRGLDKLDANQERMTLDLETHWEVIGEGAQTILRAAGLENAYDQVKALTRGKSFTSADFETWVQGLSVNDAVRNRLRALAPTTYMGLAKELADRALEDE